MAARAWRWEDARRLACGLAAALLPKPENERVGNACHVDVARFSFLVGVIEAVAGGLGFLFGAIAFMGGALPIFNRFLLEHWMPGLNTTHFAGGGLIALLVWCAQPVAWVLMLEGLTGLVRIFAFATSREPVGELWLWAVLRLWDLGVRWLQGERHLRQLGPIRADRLIWRPSRRLEILACRRRDDWRFGTTLEVNERFLRFERLEERVEGAYHVMVYHFREIGEHDVIRGLIRYVETTEWLQQQGRGEAGGNGDGGVHA